ncbi:MAG: YifB family Mg chelatase-like AAA ATPase [Sporichthyaceae bacterium]|nr:YifB family Mg chelatase-like AAA ATPase [Sporichthyaceae bacterium]
MALARAYAVGLVGLAGHVVEVEAHIGPGLPGFTLIGLPDAVLYEARDRVRAAVINSCLSWPDRRMTVSLSPASLHKRGSSFDLAVACAVLGAGGAVPRAALADLVLVGELGLDGRVRPVRGVLPAVLAAVRAGMKRFAVPAANRAEAELVPDAEVLAVRGLAELVGLLGGEVPDDEALDLEPEPDPVLGPDAPTQSGSADYPLDLADVCGQLPARRALEVSGAGGHHLYLQGPPGAGKTMLAERLPGILPPLDLDAALEVTSIHSVAGMLPADRPLLTRPPFCNPHHTASVGAIVGGGSTTIRPGAVSLAHHGVLFLDEAPEFRAGVLDGLRQPMESGEVVIARAQAVARFPARFQLVMAANPCPCGLGDSADELCGCPAMARRRYLARLSGPLLDRVDLRLTVARPSRADLVTVGTGESSQAVAERVALARDRAARRLAGTPWRVNADLPGRELRGRFAPQPGSTTSVERAMSRGQLSARGLARVLRVAWTIADLNGAPRPGLAEVDLALKLRSDGHLGAVV